MGLKKFDGKINSNNKKVPIIILCVAILVLGGFIAFFVTFAKFKVTHTYNVIEGIVKDVKDADITVYVKLVDPDGTVKSTTSLPSFLAYDYDSEKSKCESGSTLTFDTENWKYTITAGNRDKCILYFNHRNDKNIGDAAKVGDKVKFGQYTFEVISINSEDGTVKIKLIGEEFDSTLTDDELKSSMDTWYASFPDEFKDFISSIAYPKNTDQPKPGPMLNIKADVALYGTGTEADMFRLEK